LGAEGFTTHSVLRRQLRAASKYIVAVVILLAFPVLIGWEFDITFLRQPFANLGAMNPLSAACFLLSGILFTLVQVPEKNKWQNLTIHLLAIIIFTLGLVRLAGVLGFIDFQIDLVLFGGKIKTALDVNVSNRMSSNSAINFMLFAVGMSFTNTRSQIGKSISNHLVLITFLIALFAVVGYIYDIGDYYRLPYIPMPFHSAVGFIFLSSAVLLVQTETGFMAVISSSDSGGTLARILIPVTILFPILFGYIWLVFQWKFSVSEELGIAVLIISIIFLLFIFIWITSLTINKKDLLRKAAEQELLLINAALEQKVVERSAEIFKNEKFFRALIENSADAIVLIDTSLKVLFQSPGAERMTGISPERRRSYPDAKYLHPEDEAHIKRVYGDSFKYPGIPIPFQSRFLHLHGHYIWIEGLVTNLLHDPNVNAYAVNYRDVSERKDAEERLQQAEKRFRALVENEYSITSTLNEKFEITYRSPSANTILGFTDEERHIIPNEELNHPDETEYQRSLMKRLLANPGKPIPIIMRSRHKNGSYVWLEGVGVNRLADPSIQSIIINILDVTARKEAEEKIATNELRFKALIENITDAIVMNDIDSRLIYQSPSVERILGYTEEERVGKTISHYVHPQYREDFQSLYKELEKNPGKPLPFQYQFLHKLGHYVWLEGVVTNLLNDPNMKAIVANYRDITQRKEAEDEVLRLNTSLEAKVAERTAQLEAVNKELEGFSYSVSHDLRAPLRIIDGFSQILIEDHSNLLDADGKKTLGVITNNARKMGQLIDDLLSFSQLGRSKIRMSIIDVNDLVKEVMAELQHAGELKSGSIAFPENFHVDPLAPAKGDRGLIKQVWTNLISNAVKYSSKKDTPVITIGMKEENGKAVYFIKDNGAGFDMQYSSKLFGVFQRLHKQEEFSGTGVGLALVQRIILRHEGRIWAEAALGEGATFYFTLPA
jgi:PAS domain S-box-containing protein